MWLRRLCSSIVAAPIQGAEREGGGYIDGQVHRGRRQGPLWAERSDGAAQRETSAGVAKGTTHLNPAQLDRLNWERVDREVRGLHAAGAQRAQAGIADQ